MRSKRGERERRAEREGERTGWAARPGKQLVGSALVAIRDGRHWRRLVVIRFRSALTSFFAWAVDAGGVALVACVRPVVARGGRAWFSSALVVVCALSCHWRVVVSFARCRVVCAMSCHLRVFVVFVRRSWRLLSFVDGWDLVSRWA